MKIGRNEPCPCGSGKKFKKCCLALEGSENLRKQENQNKEEGHLQGDLCGSELGGHGYDLLIADEIDELSNQVPELIRAGRFEDAETIGLELLNRFPGQIDGFERLANVYEARGEIKKAIEYYRKAATLAAMTEGFDQETINWLSDEAQRLELMSKH